MPSCSACSSRNVQCVYTSDPNVTRTLATKRKYEALEEDLTAIRELYAHLQSRPNREATEIFQRIRSGADPISVLRFIQDGDLLIQPFLAAAAHNQTAHKSILGLSLREPDLYLFRFLPRSQENGSAEEVINTSFVNDGRSLHGDVDELCENTLKDDLSVLICYMTVCVTIPLIEAFPDLKLRTMHDLSKFLQRGGQRLSVTKPSSLICSRYTLP